MSILEKSWLYFLMLVLAAFVSVAIYFIVSPKHVIRYDLTGEYSRGIPEIRADVENSADYTIQLSKEVTWSEAVYLVDSLNKTIK